MEIFILTVLLTAILLSIDITSFPFKIVADSTLFESAVDNWIESFSSIICSGSLAVADETSSPLAEIVTVNEEFRASLFISTLSSPGLLPVTSTIILPGRIIPVRFNIPELL